MDHVACDTRVEINKQYVFTSFNWPGIEKGYRSEKDLQVILLRNNCSERGIYWGVAWKQGSPFLRTALLLECVSNTWDTANMLFSDFYQGKKLTYLAHPGSRRKHVQIFWGLLFLAFGSPQKCLIRFIQTTSTNLSEVLHFWQFLLSQLSPLFALLSAVG